MAAQEPLHGTSDTFLVEFERFERVYQRRKSRFLALQQRQDVPKDRLFLLSDQRPWQVFQNGYTFEKLQRRKLVFEHSQNLPKLHEACVSDDRKQVRDLLNTSKVCVLERDSCGRIALHHVAIMEHMKIAKKLLQRRDAKLQVHIRDNSNRTALHYILEKIELLALHRHNGLRISTAEMRAGSKRYRRLWELADRMLGMFSRKVLERGWGGGGPDSESLKVLDLRCRGDAWDTCRSGDVERLEMIVKVYGWSAEEWQLSELKRTLLHEACEWQQMQVVNFLLSTIEVPVQAQDSSGCTALHCAARRGFLDVCLLLLGKLAGDCGDQCVEANETAEQLALIQDVRGRTALHWCLLGSSDPLTRVQIGVLLSRSCPATLHICDHDGVSPLHLAIWRGNLDLVQHFISLGANVCGSSPSRAPLHREEYPEKAAWAPCGIVFQHRRRSQTVAPTISSVDEALGAGDSNPNCKKGAPDWESVQHPVEALWYWQRRSSKSEDSAIGSKTQDGDAEVLFADDELGCRKYGGICDQCKVTATSIAKTSSSATNVNRFQSLSPLLLAIRVCGLKWDFCSLHARRLAIVELLLMNGANPDELQRGDSEVKSHSRKTELSTPSALEEGLRVFPRYPQIFSVLLQHGAEQVKVNDIERWCFSQCSIDAKRVEAALCILLELDNVAGSCEFVVLLFVRKYFCTLGKLLNLWPDLPRQFTSAKGAVVNNDDKCVCGSPWKCILESVMSWKNRRSKPGEIRAIDIEHLEAVYGWVSVIQQGEGGTELHPLLEYCVDQYLQQRSSLRTPVVNPVDVAAAKSTSECEHILLLCIHVFFEHWKVPEDGDQRMKSKAAKWLQPTILLGYFECALVLLETLNRLGGRCRLLNTVFEFYASAIDARRHQRRILSHHREFLMICIENLLKAKPSTTDTDQPQSDDVASARALVYMCTNNMPLDIIKSCFNIVFSDVIALTTLKTMRVGGKTMMRWIVLHARVDIMEWLLVTIPEGLERGSYWSQFVAVSVTGFCKERHKVSSVSLDTLFAAYREFVQHYLSISERTDLFITLMIRHAIPNDWVELIARLVETWGAMESTNGDKENITLALKESHVLHAIARWGAIRIAEYFLSGRCSSNEAASDHINWHQIFVDQIEERHQVDECTPLELCKLLGHNRLFSLLSARVLQASILPAKNNVDADEDMPDKPETAAALNTEEDSIVHYQVGVLRSVLGINETLQNTNQDEVFNGYRRWANVTDDWMSAVALNQVSHLQAMALTRPECTCPYSSVCASIVTAVKNASLGALKWILEANAPVTKHLSDAESVECMHAAARHPGDVYAKMTLLLLENQLSPGRLSGDGMGIPLLHHAACFFNSSLACRIMTMLLERSDCDVNALDAFGNTAVSYALAAGRLHNACFLIQNLNCRLEAEYEGQASFYYVLHIAPSFASRAIIRELLMAKRDRAFLHCDADNKTCGCKSFERNGDENRALCGFCGHEASSHRMMPLPSWFRDQYDTYLAPNSAQERPRSSSGEDSNSDTETSHNLSEFNAAGDEDEETVHENERGRLDVEMLKRITVVRYDDLLHANGLAVDAQVADETITARSDRENCRPTWNNSTEIEYIAEMSCTNTPEEPSQSTAEGILQRDADKCVDLNGTSSRRRDATSSGGKLTDYPWWLRQELAMVHSPRCLCQKSAFVTNPTQLVLVAVCRWLRHTAIAHKHAALVRDLGSSCSSAGVTETAIVALASVQPAFEHWRDVARLEVREPAKAVARPSTRVLRSVLFQWQHGKEFLAFQRWKNHRTSAEVTHHRLATRLEEVVADMRRHRFATLNLRQQKLQDSTRSLLSFK